MSPEETVKYVDSLHEFGHQGGAPFEDPEWIMEAARYELETISLDDPSIKWPKATFPDVAQDYAKRNTPLPPIVIGTNRYVIDGFHRQEAARMRGDKTIQAYMGKTATLLKKADVPDVQTPEAPASKEYDAVRWIYQQYYDDKIQKLPWRDFQKKFQQFAQKYPNLWMEVRQNRPQITMEDLDRWLEENAPEKKAEPAYKVEQTTYHEPETSFRDVEQLVLQINRSANADRILAQQPLLAKYVDMVGQSSEMSGHPANRRTIGWLRVDFVNDDWLLIDEVQSDLVNSVSQAKLILEADSFEEFMASLHNEKVRQMAMEKGINARSFAQAKQRMIQEGYNLDSMEEIKRQLVDLSEDWAEYAIATVIDIARKHGIKNIAIHTADTIGSRDEALEGQKVHMYYDALAHSFGFRKKQLDFGELSGNFWVRTAARKAAEFKFFPQTDEWIGRAKEFLRGKWAERHRELSREGAPPDLGGACKFASLFAQKLFGGWIVGNSEHQIVKTPHRLIDLTDRFDPNTFRHDKEFWLNPEHEESMRSCEPRVQKWVEEFKQKYLPKEGESVTAKKQTKKKPLVEKPKEYAEARKDPRQVSLYGPGHTQELQEMYAKPKNAYRAPLLHDPEAGS